MSRRKFPDSIYEEAATLRERGWGLQRLANRFGCSVGVLRWNFLKLGAETKSSAKRVLPQTRPGAPVFMRNGHAVRSYTPADDELILRLEREGLGDTAIGRRLDPPRKPNSIKGRLMTLARHEARREAAAEARQAAE